jgi:hypothetical protein
MSDELVDGSEHERRASGPTRRSCRAARRAPRHSQSQLLQAVCLHPRSWPQRRQREGRAGAPTPARSMPGCPPYISSDAQQAPKLTKPESAALCRPSRMRSCQAPIASSPSTVSHSSTVRHHPRPPARPPTRPSATARPPTAARPDARTPRAVVTDEVQRVWRAPRPDHRPAQRWHRGRKAKP